jgi:putative transposase
MPRQPRFFFPGAVLHVIQRGNNRARVFTCAADYRFYLDCLGDASTQHGVAIHAYVLMPNHVHVLVSPSDARSLPRMMQKVGRKYVAKFNFMHARTGTLWEGRYKATLVDTDEYLLACQRYVELNPVRACIVATPADYRWSSHRANAYGCQDRLVTPHCAFAAMAGAVDRYEAYRRLFDLPLPSDIIERIREATQFEWALGDQRFRARVASLTARRPEKMPMGRPRLRR